MFPENDNFLRIISGKEPVGQYNVSYMVSGKSLRWVTVLYPDGGEELKITSVCAQSDILKTEIEISLTDGTVIMFDEDSHLNNVKDI